MYMIRKNTLHALLLSSCALAVPGLGSAQSVQGASVSDNSASQSSTATQKADKTRQDEATDLKAVVVASGITYRSHIDVPAPKLTYSKQFFAKFEPVSVGDQLRRVPGVAFVGDIGESVAPELRGLGHGYTQILVNGRPVPGIGNDRSVAVDRIPAEIVDHIEIIRSPTADMDSQGIGGTINIVLKDGATLPPGVIVRVGETWDKKTGKYRPNAALSWSGQNDAKTVFYSLTLDAQKRFNEKHSVQGVFEDDSQGFAEEVAAGGMGRSLQSWDDRSRSTAVEREEQGDQRESKDISFNGDLTWNLSKQSTLRLDAYALSTRRDEHENTDVYEGDGTPGGFDSIDHKYEDVSTDEDSRGLSATFYSTFGDLTSIEAYLGRDSINGGETKYKYKHTADNLDKIEATSADDDDWQADVAITRQMPGFAEALGMMGAELKFGIQAKNKNRDFDQYTNDVGDDTLTDGSFNYKEHRVDGYARIKWFFNPAVTLATGVRWENTRTKQRFINTVTNGGTVTDKQTGSADSKVSMLNPSAHLQWRVSDTDQIRFSVARTVRRPSIDQLVPATVVESPEDYSVTVGNPDLEMERSLGFDLGYERTLGKKGVIGVNLFTRKISNLIGLVKTDRPVSDVGQDPNDYPGGLYTYKNIGDAKVHGVELDLSTPLSVLGWDHTGIFGNYTRLFSSRPDPVTGRDIEINDQPTYVYNVGVTQDIPSWNASLGASYQRQGMSRFVTIGEMESTKFDGNLEIFIEKRFGDSFILRLTGTNLLDACSYQMEPNFDGDSSAEILANQAAFNVDAYEVERECSSPRWSLTFRAVF